MDNKRSPNRSSSLSHQEAARRWRQLRIFNLYRIILGAIFVSATYIRGLLPSLGTNAPDLFEITSLSYLAIAIISSFLIQSTRFDFRLITYSLAIIDIMVLTLLMRASGGIESGLGMLLIVSIAGNSLLLSSRSASLFAAIAALAMLAEQVYAVLEATLLPNFTQAGLLGITLFATALLAHTLSSRIRESEALAAQRGVDLANLAQLNQHVLQRMQSGIIVVDSEMIIRLINESAWQMLGLPNFASTSNKNLKSISPELAEQLLEWRRGGVAQPRIVRSRVDHTELLPSMTSLGSDASAGTLIFLEDAARMAQQAQQMKLASLGRLTASIAHEVRNPLGAISHAEQLLSESASNDPGDQRLLEIIHTNTSRVNDIIENVLQLSRRDRAAPENINLREWLDRFIDEFVHSQGCETDEIIMHISPDDCQVNMDATQLHQVLWNLCSNALRYSPPLTGQHRLELLGGLTPDTKKPFLDIIDFGPGISPDVVDHIFEPFFTTENKGSGLGLYIASELCQSNDARLSYIAIPGGGSCFRIEFSKTHQSLNSKPKGI